MRRIIELPQFPMTEIYEPWKEGPFTPTGFVDQAFLYCEPCSHGKLETLVPPEKLYGQGYRTETARSVGASHSVRTFFEFIRSNVDSANYETVIDIGANDSSLLQYFDGKRHVGVDPNASGEGVELIREFVEKADLQRFKAHKKLILCSHTLEHIERPDALLAKVSSILAYGDSCAFQFPSLDCLVRDARVDQIHHQHVHYFSLRSISLMLAKHQLEIVKAEFDDAHYGTLRIIFRRGLEELKGRMIMTHEIRRANTDFLHGMVSFGNAVVRLREPVGYGASLMLPVLRYYAPALENLLWIVDQDEAKNGLRYVNFNKEIRKPGLYITGADWVVTAFNTKLAVRKIAAKLCENEARNVVVPFNAL
jgi:hypothetical protein